MTPIDSFIKFIVNFNIWILAKILVMAALGLYILFAFLVLQEVNLMARTLKGVFNLPIKITSLIHLIFSILVFILALVIL
ncbi:MAG TPA: DUF5657 family protein [Candidatus Bathyarchaeia archaeon]|nr:DUF5657 family protein [Candidatus Bathyarchaeia archaeon]